MIQYGSDVVTQLRFEVFHPRIERRDDQWVDIELGLELSHLTPMPAGLTELTALVICTVDGVIAQIVPLDEGCDCEFQFTADEKEQIRAFIERPDIQKAITNTASPS
ncbi:hypothetical protein KZ483_13670 [Paenibacillus sp. sptzw28]|uniref:hypothetical protein n=1 Tax=Paenibacillus sp. sptzw28 TaxID=715179 RepID=UPI001C6E24B9|nr:hypothetical protein [Paenibacillus sp. sptzw28]QYR19027.1 hypothetical protein KZ483_13670 [Paenibacillus sp. sptzw28]